MKKRRKVIWLEYSQLLALANLEKLYKKNALLAKAPLNPSVFRSNVA